MRTDDHGCKDGRGLLAHLERAREVKE